VSDQQDIADTVCRVALHPWGLPSASSPTSDPPAHHRRTCRNRRSRQAGRLMLTPGTAAASPPSAPFPGRRVKLLSGVDRVEWPVPAC
jgi:hypothetical protein